MFIQKNQYRLTLLCGVFLFVLLMPEGTLLAQAGVATGNAAKGQQGIDVKSIASIFGMLNTFMHIVTLILMQFLQYLLQSDFFTNSAMMTALNRIWQLSRDVVNIAFAVMLIGVAFYTIITSDKKFITEKLQSFVLAVILVNFSWFFPRVIIDVANVLTATVYTVPDIMTGGFQCTTWDDAGNPTPCKGLVDVKLLPKDVNEERAYCGVLPPDRCNCLNHIACYKYDTLQSMRANGASGVGHVMLNGLLINYTKFINLIKIPTSNAGPAPAAGTAWEGFMTTLRILMGIMVAFVIQGAIFLPLVALTGVLLARILVLWMTTAFMPFVFLGYVINGKLGTGGIVKGMDFDLWEQFIGAAFLPTIVAVPITIGFVMLTAVTSISAPPLFMGPIDVPLLFGVKTWWALLWMAASVMVLWKGAFMALKTSQYANTFVEKVQGIGESMAGAAMRLPLLAPLPMGGNIGSMFHSLTQIPEAVRISSTSGRDLNDVIRGMRSQNNDQAAIPGTTFEETSRHINDQNQSRIVQAIQSIRGNTSDANALRTLRTELHVQNASLESILKQIQGVLANTNVNAAFKNDMRGIDIQQIIGQLNTRPAAAPAPAAPAPAPAAPPAAPPAPGGA